MRCQIACVVVVSVLLCLFSEGAFAAAAKTKPAGRVAEVAREKPTREGVLALADRYLKASEPKLDFESKQGISAIRTRLMMVKNAPTEQEKTVGALVNQLTVALAELKKIDALMVASGILVQTAPANPRTANLFGAVLHTAGKAMDAQTVMEYVLSLEPKSCLAMLNLANACLDSGDLAKAKSLADKVLAKDSDCMDAHRVLATYWYQKKNLALFRREMLKAVKFAGYVRKKAQKQDKEIEDESGDGNDSPEVLEQKTKQLQGQVPFTTAEIIEQEFPAQARQIRDKYCKLGEDAKMILPRLPECNTNSPNEFKRNGPIVGEWVAVFARKQKKFALEETKRMGINPNVGEEAAKAQAKAAAKKQLAEKLQEAEKMLNFLKSMRGMGVTQGQINQATAQIQRIRREQGVQASPNTEKPSDPSVPPGFDSGSPLARMNYANYIKIANTYELYFFNYFMWRYNPRVQDILKNWRTTVAAEGVRHEAIQAKLDAEHHKHDDVDAPCRREWIRHRRALNAISETYFKQWAALFFPQYAQKMKPTLDAYWNVCMLYIRNMNDPKVMEREYYRVKRTYMQYAMMAGSAIAVGGTFDYLATTEEEEKALERDIQAAKKEAEQKRPQMERAYKEADTDWTKWIEDHLVLEVSGEFLSLKITATTIEFEAWAFGPGAGIKVDMLNETLETYVGVGVKLKMGVNIGGMGAEVEAKGDFARRMAKWDFEKGTYEESYGAKAEGKGAFGAVSAGGEVELNTQLEAKAVGKITAGDMLTVQSEAQAQF